MNKRRKATPPEPRSLKRAKDKVVETIWKVHGPKGTTRLAGQLRQMHALVKNGAPLAPCLEAAFRLAVQLLKSESKEATKSQPPEVWLAKRLHWFTNLGGTLDELIDCAKKKGKMSEWVNTTESRLKKAWERGTG